MNVKQDNITIGVATYNNPTELTMGYLLKLPFTKIRKKSSAVSDDKSRVY
jgi:hypothetical protein